MVHRRALLGLSIIPIIGCVNYDNVRNGGGNETENPSEDAETGRETDVPYDIPRAFILRGRFVDESDVEKGFRVVSSDDDRFDDHQSYRELFEAVEDVPESKRQPDHGIQAEDTLSPDSQAGIALRETIADIRDGMDADEHKNDRWESRWGTHYIEHDGSILMVYMDDGGVPE